MSHRHLALLGLLCTLPLLGFGCKKPNAAQNGDLEAQRRGTNWLYQNLAANKPAAKIPVAVKPQPVAVNSGADNPIYPEVTTLRHAFTNLAGADSFRATISLPLPQGSANGALEYSKNSGVHATIKSSDGLTTEMYLLDSTVFYRTGTSTWINATDTPDGNKLQVIFKQIMPTGNQQTVQPKIIIVSHAKLQSVSDDPTGCKRYLVTQFSDTGEKQDFNVCVKDGFPISVSITTPSGITQLEYKDINQPITITAPVR